MTTVPTRKIVKVACTEAPYLIRCACRTLGRYTLRDCCRIHGPKPFDLNEYVQTSVATTASDFEASDYASTASPLPGRAACG
jgi:hypothetical protein